MTFSAFASCGFCSDSSSCPLKKRIFLTLHIFVFLSPWALEYSHDLQAQKKAPMLSRARDFCLAVVDLL